LTSIDLKFIDEEKASEESSEESKEGNMVNMPKIISKGLIHSPLRCCSRIFLLPTGKVNMMVNAY
jgi:hypothetical protein